MYLDNKYTRWYKAIISAAQARLSNDGYTEKHHILPRSLGGNNKKDNIVALTPREHFICHLLLTKMTEGNAKYKMIYSLHMLSNVKNIGMGRYTPSSRMYAYARSLFMDSMHTIWTPEKRAVQSKKISSIMKASLAKMSTEEKAERMKNSASSPKSWTSERIEKMKAAQRGKKKSKTPAMKVAAEQRKLRIQANPLRCGDANRGKTWKLIEGKRVWIEKENDNY